MCVQIQGAPGGLLVNRTAAHLLPVLSGQVCTSWRQGDAMSPFPQQANGLSCSESPVRARRWPGCPVSSAAAVGASLAAGVAFAHSRVRREPHLCHVWAWPVCRAPCCAQAASALGTGRRARGRSGRAGVCVRLGQVQDVHAEDNSGESGIGRCL